MLFGDAATYGDPDKVVAEGYRMIPLMFPEYEIQPRVWNRETKKLEPVALNKYDQFLAGIDIGMTKAMGDKEQSPKQENLVESLVNSDKDTPSKMRKLAASEKYNLAVGVYTGFVTAYDRVKPTPRTTAAIDLVGMSRSRKVASTEEAVDYFSRRLLSVPLSAERRAAVLQFMQHEVGGDRLDYDSEMLPTALQRLVHLILSSPEYQLN